MNILQTPHFQNYKLLLTLFGQWPTQPTFQRRLIRCIITLIILSIFIPKLIKLVESINDIDIVIEAVPNIGLHLASLCKYFFWTINFDKIKKLIFLIDDDGKTLKGEPDITIMQKFLDRVRTVTSAYTVIVYTVLVVFCSTPLVPKILDIVKPLNTSRPNIYLYQTEYFVDRDEYYTAILLHTYLTMPISLGVVTIFDNMFATYIHHTCGMLSVLRHYLESMNYDMYNQDDKKLDTKKISQHIIKCIKIHKNSIQFTNILESCCTIAFMIVGLMNLFVITINGMATVMKLDQFNEAIRFALFTFGSTFHLFYTNYQGQILIEHSEMILNAVYSSNWYSVPPKLRKLLIPMMMKSCLPCKITAGKVVVLSMDSFSTVLKNSISFFTVFSSLQ